MSHCKYNCKSKGSVQFFMNNRIICPTCDELLLDIEIEEELPEESAYERRDLPAHQKDSYGE